MSGHALRPTLAAVVKALRASRPLKLITGDRVLGYVPATTPMPYVRVAILTAADAGTKDALGQEITLQVHSWSNAPDPGQSLDMAKACYDVLHEANLGLVDDANTAYFCRCDFEENIEDRYEATPVFHHVQRFRIYTMAARPAA